MKTVPLKKIEAELKARYLRSVCDLQLEYARRRQTAVGATKLQFWLRGSFQKDAFCWSMVRAESVREPYTQSEICDETGISRQSVSDMVKHCLAEGWIKVHCDDEEIEPNNLSQCKGVLKYSANVELYDLAMAYVDRHINTTQDTFMNKNWDDLMAVRKTIAAVQ